MNKFARFVRPAKVAVCSGLMAAGVAAHAALPADVTTSLTTMKTDGVEAGTLVIVALVAIAALMIIRKVIR